jgi:ABC-type taurine transport system substrate-binding protein
MVRAEMSWESFASCEISAVSSGHFSIAVLASHPIRRAQRRDVSSEPTEIRKLLQRSEPAARRETNSSARSTHDLADRLISRCRLS